MLEKAVNNETFMEYLADLKCFGVNVDWHARFEYIYTCLKLKKPLRFQSLQSQAMTDKRVPAQ